MQPVITTRLKKQIKSLPSKPGIYIFKDGQNKDLYIGKAANLKSRVNSYLKTEDSRIRRMVESAQTLKHLVASSDIEALILESQYIKARKPMFNIMLRDDKQYFYVGFSKDKFPRIFLTHQPTSKKGYIGPFTDGNALKTTLRYLRGIFPYCTCTQKHNNYCLNYHIGKCPGFCCLKNPEITSKGRSEYKKSANAVKSVLSGKKLSLIKKLEKEMISQAKADKFEEAIKTRTKLERLQRIFENARLINEFKSLEDVLNSLKNSIGLDRVPQRIEAYDISNIQGQNATCSMIVFENGRPNKNEYRKFKIRTVWQASDTDMLKEVLFRRFNHPEWPLPDLIIIDGGKGQLSVAASITGKLEIATVALTKNAGHKGEKITISNNKSINLSEMPEETRNLILAIDAEAHRFAISYYRKLHRNILR